MTNITSVRLTATVAAALAEKLVRSDADAERAYALLTASRRAKDGSITIAPEPRVAVYLQMLAATILESDMRDESGDLYVMTYGLSFGQQQAARRLENSLDALYDALRPLAEAK